MALLKEPRARRRVNPTAPGDVWFGTFETCRWTVKMPAYRGRTEVNGAGQNDANDPKRIWQIPSLDYLVGAGEDRRRHCETIQKPIFQQVSCWTLLGSFASGATMRASPVVSLCPPFCQAGAAHRTASISLTTCSAASPSAAIAAANRTAAARNRGSSSTRRIAAEI